MFITWLIGFRTFLVLLGCDNKSPQSPRPPPPISSQETICGAIQGLICPDDEQYCYFGIGHCKVADALGICKTISTICTEEFSSICGCDGKTYDNACTAAAACISIGHPGECVPPEPKGCGGIEGIKCQKTGYALMNQMIVAILPTAERIARKYA